jgi:plasmid maintenance system antidote protein VapI
MTPKEILNENLMFLMHRDGMEPIDLAKGLGVDRKRVSHWVKNDIVPNVDVIVLISELFDVGIDNLLTVRLKEL